MSVYAFMQILNFPLYMYFYSHNFTGTSIFLDSENSSICMLAGNS